jgi:hypothetical protein
MRKSKREVRRIEKAEKVQGKRVEKKKAHLEKISQKGDPKRSRRAEVEVNRAIAALEQIKADRTRIEIRDQIFAFVEHNQPVEIAKIADALNLPADSIEKHIELLEVAKDEDGKLYTTVEKPSRMKLGDKLTSLKGKIREIGQGIKVKAQKDQMRVVIEKWKEIAKVNPGLTQDELKGIYIMLYPEEEGDIERYLEKIKEGAKIEEGAKVEEGTKTKVGAKIKEIVKAEDERWIEPAMCFLVALSSAICYLCSHSSLFMDPPPSSSGISWYYWDLIRFDWYHSAFLSLLIFAILGGLLLWRYRKIGVPILIIGAVLQFLLSPVYIVCSQPSSFNWLSLPTLSLSILALMPIVLATCLVLISVIAWIRKPLPKERVEELKRRLKWKSER